MQLAVGDESAIAAEIQRHRGAGDLLRLVGIAEQELAGRKRPPVAGAVDRAVAVRFAHLEVARILPLEDGIAQRIGEPEVLLGGGTALPVRPALHDRGQVLVPGQRPFRADCGPGQGTTNPAGGLARASISRVFASSSSTGRPSGVMCAFKVISMCTVFGSTVRAVVLLVHTSSKNSSNRVR